VTTGNHRDVPSPPRRDERAESLPGGSPKPATENPEAPSKLKQILQGTSYRQADDDVEFLHRDENRGIRLQLEYLKPELTLQAHGVGYTIVVFGSSRIVEPRAAQAEVDALQAALEADPGNREQRRRLRIAKSLRDKCRYYDMAREFGRLVAESGGGPRDCRLVVMTGGGPGTMEAANRGASDAGAASVGLNIHLPHQQFPNPYITPELCFRFRYFALRKLHFLMRARALVAFPGGFGTFDELFGTLTLVQTGKIAPVPIVLVGASYWRRAFDVDFLCDEGVIDEEDRDLFWYAESAQEIWQGILRWYEKAGSSIFAPGCPIDGE
jgi:hypothetical protein